MADKFGISALIVSVVSTTVSVGALVISSRQAEETHRFNELSVRPAITFYYDTDERVTKRPGLYAINTGLGPAVVKSFKIYVDAKPIRDWGVVADAISRKMDPIKNDYEAGDVINKGDKDLLFGPGPRDKEPDEVLGRRHVRECCARSRGDTMTSVAVYKPAPKV